MAKCSNHSHDRADIAGEIEVDPDELLADITMLDSWVKDLRSRATATRKRRKAVSH